MIDVQARPHQLSIEHGGVRSAVHFDFQVVIAVVRHRPAGGCQQPLRLVQTICDEVDLILVTHDHLDHFDAGLVRQYLQANPKTRIASTSQVTAKLSDLKEQVITLNARQGKTDQVIVNEIQVKAYFLSHDKEAGDVINYGYLITINDILFFHAGDFNDSAGALSVLKTYQLDQEGIDVAFVPYWLLPLFTIDSDNDRIGSKHIFPIHYQFYDVQFIKELYHPQAIFFDYNLQSWIMPEEE